MKGKPGYPRTLSLFRAPFDEDTATVLGSDLVDPILLLALARWDLCGAMKSFLLAGAAGTKEGLLALGANDVQALIMRSFATECWKPAFFWEMALEDADYFARRGIAFVAITDSAYPPQLREVYRPPFGFYLRGRLPDPSRPAVGIVGTRAPTGRALGSAFALAFELSAKGFCVISGLARGIDSARIAERSRAGARRSPSFPAG